MLLVLLSGMERACGAVATVAAYDAASNPNGVDFTAAGSAFAAGDFAAQVIGAFAGHEGGVVNFDGGAVEAGAFIATFGAGGAKSVVVANAGGAVWFLDDAPAGRTPISGSGVLSGNSVAGFEFAFGSVSGGAPGEAVIALGLTVLSRSGISQPFHFGVVRAVAQWSGGGSAEAQRLISEANAAGDTFFGFMAPPGQSIAGLSLVLPSGNFTSVDDLAFITAVVPESGSLGLLALGGLGLLGRRRAGPR